MLDFSSVSWIDSTAADGLVQCIDLVRSVEVRRDENKFSVGAADGNRPFSVQANFYVAAVNGRCLTMLKRGCYIRGIGENNIFA